MRFWREVQVLLQTDLQGDNPRHERSAGKGRFKAAIEWMGKAREIAGETPEVLCRYSIIYSFFDKGKSDQYLEECQRKAPSHPRANYLRGIDLKEQGDVVGAIEFYKTAIENYPPTDRYHLNEAWNNLGTAYFDLDDFAKAKDLGNRIGLYTRRSCPP